MRCVNCETELAAEPFAAVCDHLDRLWCWDCARKSVDLLPDLFQRLAEYPGVMQRIAEAAGLASSMSQAMGRYQEAQNAKQVARDMQVAIDEMIVAQEKFGWPEKLI